MLAFFSASMIAQFSRTCKYAAHEGCTLFSFLLKSNVVGTSYFSAVKGEEVKKRKQQLNLPARSGLFLPIAAQRSTPDFIGYRSPALPLLAEQFYKSREAFKGLPKVWYCSRIFGNSSSSFGISAMSLSNNCIVYCMLIRSIGSFVILRTNEFTGGGCMPAKFGKNPRQNLWDNRWKGADRYEELLGDFILMVLIARLRGHSQNEFLSSSGCRTSNSSNQAPCLWCNIGYLQSDYNYITVNCNKEWPSTNEKHNVLTHTINNVVSCVTCWVKRLGICWKIEHVRRKEYSTDQWLNIIININLLTNTRFSEALFTGWPNRFNV